MQASPVASPSNELLVYVLGAEPRFVEKIKVTRGKFMKKSQEFSSIGVP